MTRDQVVEALKREEVAIRRYGATSLYLFGSAARDELGPESDIDVFIDYVRDGSLGFRELCLIEDRIGSVLSRRVDLTTREGLHRSLREHIVRSSTRVF